MSNDISEMFANMTSDLYKSTIMSWVEDPGVEEVEGLNLTALNMDQAYVVATSTVPNVGVYAVSDDCYRCPYELQQTLGVGSTSNWTIDTSHRFTWRVFSSAQDRFISSKNRSNLICEIRPDVGEFGVYSLNVTSSDCEVQTLQEPVDIHMPLLLVLLVLLGVAVMYSAFSLVWSHFHKKGKLRYGDKELAIQQRLRALDTFRGIAIVLMIFINDGAGGYWWLEHASWNGLTVGDLVFPAFLWIMGVCIPLSVKGAFAKGIPRWKILMHILRRSCLLFVLGMSMNTVFGSVEVGALRVWGVLQRLGAAYLLAASAYTLSAAKYYAPPRGACGQALKDVFSVAWCWLFALCLVAAHTTFLLTIHHPDCPPGYMGPGGKHDNWAAPECTGGATGYIDRFLLGDSHLLQHYDARKVYGGPPFDPEGLLGCLTSVVQVLLGVQTGATILYFKSHKSRLARWMAWAVVFALIGAILCGFSKEKGIIPINKNLWSISFVLVTSAFCLVLLSGCYALTDAWGAWGGSPFRAPGLNAIALYIGHSLCAKVFPFHWALPPPLMRTHTIHLLEALWGTILWVVIATIMARKKVYITL